MAKYYPIYVDIQDQPVLVVGGGTVALRKVETLLAYGAIVRIVSPCLVPELEALVDNRQCFWSCKNYSDEDLQDAVLVFSCTEKEEVNAAVAGQARKQGRPVNVVDDPVKCSFIVPSIWQQGDLCIAVSTGGSSPIMARQIRQEIAAHYGQETAAYLNVLKAWRNRAKEGLTPDKRQQFWETATSPHVRELVRTGRLDEVKGVIEACFRSLLA